MGAENMGMVLLPVIGHIALSAQPAAGETAQPQAPVVIIMHNPGEAVQIAPFASGSLDTPAQGLTLVDTEQPQDKTYLKEQLQQEIELFNQLMEVMQDRMSNPFLLPDGDAPDSLTDDAMKQTQKFIEEYLDETANKDSKSTDAIRQRKKRLLKQIRDAIDSYIGREDALPPSVLSLWQTMVQTLELEIASLG